MIVNLTSQLSQEKSSFLDYSTTIPPPLTHYLGNEKDIPLYTTNDTNIKDNKITLNNYSLFINLNEYNFPQPRADKDRPVSRDWEHFSESGTRLYAYFSTLYKMRSLRRPTARYRLLWNPAGDWPGKRGQIFFNFGKVLRILK